MTEEELKLKHFIWHFSKDLMLRGILTSSELIFEIEKSKYIEPQGDRGPRESACLHFEQTVS